MENGTQTTDLLVDASDSINDDEAAGLFILPNMTVGVDMPTQYMTNDASILPPHVQRVFELGLCVTSPNQEDQKRFWDLVSEIAKKRMQEQGPFTNV